MGIAISTRNRTLNVIMVISIKAKFESWGLILKRRWKLHKWLNGVNYARNMKDPMKIPKWNLPMGSTWVMWSTKSLFPRYTVIFPFWLDFLNTRVAGTVLWPLWPPERLLVLSTVSIAEISGLTMAPNSFESSASEHSDSELSHCGRKKNFFLRPNETEVERKAGWHAFRLAKLSSEIWPRFGLTLPRRPLAFVPARPRNAHALWINKANRCIP